MRTLSGLTPRHRRVAQLLALGTSCDDIAREVKASAFTVHDWANDALVLEEVSRIQGLAVEAARIELKAATKDAIALLRHACAMGLSNPKALSAGVKAAVAILDRAGLAPPKEEPAPEAPDVPDSIEELLAMVPTATLRRLLADKEASEQET